MQKILLLACLTVCLSTNAYAQSNAEKAEATVKAIVNIQADAVNKNATGCCWLPWLDGKGPTALMQKYYTHNFVELWRCAASTHEDIWDGDFISGEQTIVEERLISVRPANFSDNVAHIDTDIERQGDDGIKRIGHEQFVLRQENGMWKTDNVVYLDNIAHNKKYKNSLIYESQRDALKDYQCN